MQDGDLGDAIFSPCRTYRYRLERPALQGQKGPTLAFIMVNPSTADERSDDQTIRMVRLFGKRHGYGKILIGNLFAFRSKQIASLNAAAEPVGPENDFHLQQVMLDADHCYAAWGAESKLSPHLRGRWRDIADLAESLGVNLHCLDHLSGNHPRHPQILRYHAAGLNWIRPV